jgi:hypothetical protein
LSWWLILQQNIKISFEGDRKKIKVAVLSPQQQDAQAIAIILGSLGIGYLDVL